MMNRKQQRRGICASVAVIAALLTSTAWAGAQKEEALADSVRAVLSQQIADSAPPEIAFVDYADRMSYLKWLGEMGARLERRKPDDVLRQDFLKSVWYEARRAGLDPAMVMGLIEVESAFRKHAISVAGARGYMQVMPFWTRLIGDGESRTLFDLRSNLRYGCTILRHYIDLERGDLFLALGRYNGSRGRPEYPNAVLAAWKRWVMPGETPHSPLSSITRTAASTEGLTGLGTGAARQRP